MSFQAYLGTIKKKTGKDPDFFLAEAEAKGYIHPKIQTGKIITWLAKDYDLGQGHAMALVVTFKDATQPKVSENDQIADHFKGNKTIWREPYDKLLSAVSSFGNDVSVKSGASYLSFLKAGKKFAIIQVTGDRLDIGIKRKGVEPTDTFKPAGAWNSMVTHRVQISKPDQINQEIIDWLQAAYDAA